MVNSGIKRIDSPLDHIDRTARATFAPLPKPRTYSFDLSTYRDSVRRLGSPSSAPAKPSTPALPTVKPIPAAKPIVSPTRQGTITLSPTISPQLSDRLMLDRPSSPPAQPSLYDRSAQISSEPTPLAAENTDISAMPRFQLSQSDLQATLPVPVTAMNLLRDIEAAVIGWQSALHRVLSQIQQLYSDGPMIDGWLESASPEQPQHRAKQLRAELEDAAIWGNHYGNHPGTHQGHHNYIPEPTYYVCGHTETGEFWSRPCPPEQVASISLAISRYQKLQEYLRYKQTIEHHLAELAKTILEFHGQVRRIGKRQKP